MIEVSVRLLRPGFSLDVSFRAGSGITALFGASGSGKSTLLNLISGLEKPEEGSISIDSVTVFDSATGINMPAHKRRIGQVFQDSLLFPHLSVRSNLMYGFAGGGVELDAVIALLDIGRLIESRPSILSGGERQRVAIGRALLSSPRLLLMDEPLASLDIARKREILPYIERLNATFSIPVIYVSHAVDEVARLASDVIVLENGKVTAQGSPQAVLPPLESAGDRFARISVLEVAIDSYDPEYRLTSFSHPAGRICLAGHYGAKGLTLRIVVRATDVTLARERPQHISARTMLTGVISRIEQTGDPVAVAHLELEGGDALAAALTRKAVDELGLALGQRVWCILKTVSIDERWIASP